ncbi:MAG TPA: hypothetical protein VHD32_09255 [Candidatus Didemnitutus sp.]|nr:hypothetical protein [Candidatus Didemnitutus sp.]
MTHFPSNVRQLRVPTAPFVAKSAPMRDVLWGRPLFKAPSLPNPRVAFDPLPFFAQRVTQRVAAS